MLDGENIPSFDAETFQLLTGCTFLDMADDYLKADR